jgi:hypothetical protein
MCRPAPISISRFVGEGREAEGFSLSEATDEIEGCGLSISDQGDEALLHLERSDCGLIIIVFRSIVSTMIKVKRPFSPP